MKTVRWLSVAIALLALLGSGSWLFVQIRDAGKMQAENAQLKATLEIAKQAAEKNRLAYEADTERARQDRAAKLSLEGRVRSLRAHVSALENTSCLTDDDVERLRSLWLNADPPGGPAR